MKVSLTYLRGLEVRQLDVEDLPSLCFFIYLTKPKNQTDEKNYSIIRIFTILQRLLTGNEFSKWQCLFR